MVGPYIFQRKKPLSLSNTIFEPISPPDVSFEIIRNLRPRKSSAYFEFIEELFPHGLEDGLEEGAPKDEGGVEVGQGVAEGGHVTETQPTRVVHLQIF